MVQLEVKNPLERVAINTKGNHIHYVQGTKYITGLGYKTEQLSDISGTTVAPRALMETIIATAQQYIQVDSQYASYYIDPILSDTNPENPIVSGSETILGTSAFHPLFNGILAQIHYIPMAAVRSTIYKYSILDMEIDTVKFVNEQDRLNDTINLGEYVRKSANKLGNQSYVTSSRALSFNSIPEIGFMTPDNLVITSRSLNLNKNLVTYDLELNKNFINQSNYIAVNSAYRQYQVPDNDVVFRQDKYREFVILTKDKTPYIPKDFTAFTYYGIAKLVQNFSAVVGYSNIPISYAKATITKQIGSTLADNEVIFDMPINGYSIGTTLNLQTEMDTNYSVGPKKYETMLGSTFKDIYKAQTYTNYTTAFGSVDRLDLNVLHMGKTNNSEDDADLYPQYVDTAIVDPQLSLSLLIKKDAREKYGLNIEIPFITDDSDSIYIFPGIAKYNGWLTNKDNIDVKVVLLLEKYFPTITSTKIILAQTYPQPNPLWYEYDNINTLFALYGKNMTIPPMSSWSGYAIYEEKTGDLIYAVKEPIMNDTPNTQTYTTEKIWFAMKKIFKK